MIALIFVNILNQKLTKLERQKWQKKKNFSNITEKTDEKFRTFVSQFIKFLQ